MAPALKAAPKYNADGFKKREAYIFTIANASGIPIIIGRKSLSENERI